LVVDPRYVGAPAKVRFQDILFHTDKRLPVVEVWVDLEQEQITDILSPPEIIRYPNVPVPLY